MKLPSFCDLLRAHIPDLPPVIDFHSPRPANAPDPETESHRESSHSASASPQGALSTASHQSKPTTICSETAPDFAAPNPKLETRNSELAAPTPRRWKRYARQLSRPVTLTEEIGRAMYDAILRTGISDARAGQLFHVSSTTVSQWKAEDPGFAEFLESARDAFAAAELKKFRDGPARSARHGVRKSMWLLEYSNPEKWARRPRRNPAPAPSESESPDPFQQSKLTTNCSEITTDFAAPNSEHGTRNPKLHRRRRSLGRPTLLTQEIADAMYESILHTGISDSRAGSLLNVSRVTVCRWKQDDPVFAGFLEIARSKFEAAQIKKVRDTPVRNAQQGAHNAKWLLEYSNPERLGRRPRKLPTSPTSPRWRKTVSAASQSESSQPPQQSKHTTKCFETQAPTAPFPTATAPAFQPETRNSKPETAAPSAAAPNSEHETLGLLPNICGHRGGIGHLRINRPLTTVLAKDNPKPEFPVAPFSLFAFRLPLFLHPLPTE